MDSFSRLREESNKVGAEFLLTELDTALTFLNVAETTESPEVRQRDRQHAVEAYETVVRLRHKVVIKPDMKPEFLEKFFDLKNKLLKLGFEIS